MKAFCMGSIIVGGEKCLDCEHSGIHNQDDICGRPCELVGKEGEGVYFSHSCETSPLRIAVFEALQEKGGEVNGKS